MAHELPALPYDYSALEPFIDAFFQLTNRR